MTTQTGTALSPEDLRAFLARLDETDLGRQLLFQSLLPANATNTQQAQFQSLYGSTFTQFLTQLGQQIRQGSEPDLTFDEFLTQEFDPNRALLRLPGSASPLSGGRTIYNYA